MTRPGKGPKIINGREAAEILSARGWFARSVPDFRAAIIANAIVRRFPAGYVIGLAGEERGWIFGLATGSLEIAVGASALDAPFVHIGQTGFWAGYRPLLGGTPRSITSTTREESVLMTVEQSAVGRLLAENPAWWHEIARFADEAASVAFIAMADNLLRDPVRRTAAILLRLAAVRLTIQGTEPLPIRVAQDELASVVNVARNTLGPILKDFEAAGWLRMGYREIALVSVPALQGIVSGG